MILLQAGSLVYLSLLVCVVLAILEEKWDGRFWRIVFRRWLKLAGGLVGIGLVVQILTWFGS